MMLSRPERLPPDSSHVREEADRLDFNAGAEVTIGIAARRGQLIM
ncbi:hypothetical protein [Bradyrhizobium sp. cf659]|nr:hypothetical protein [Bradyrhizobium sp. cf659]